MVALQKNFDVIRGDMRVVCLDKYRMPMIFRYNLDCGNLRDST